MSFVDLYFYLVTICLLGVVVIVQYLFRKREETAGFFSKLLLLLFSFFVMTLYDIRFCHHIFKSMMNRCHRKDSFLG